MEKKGYWVQALTDAEIWYCEGGSYQIYLGLVKIRGREKIVSVLAKDPEDALEQFSEYGDLLSARSLRDLLSGMTVEWEEDPVLM